VNMPAAARNPGATRRSGRISRQVTHPVGRFTQTTHWCQSNVKLLAQYIVAEQIWGPRSKPFQPTRSWRSNPMRYFSATSVAVLTAAVALGSLVSGSASALSLSVPQVAAHESAMTGADMQAGGRPSY